MTWTVVRLGLKLSQVSIEDLFESSIFGFIGTSVHISNGLSINCYVVGGEDMAIVDLISFLYEDEKTGKQEIVAVHTWSTKLLRKLEQLLKQRQIPYEHVTISGYNVWLSTKPVSELRPEIKERIGWNSRR